MVPQQRFGSPYSVSWLCSLTGHNHSNHGKEKEQSSPCCSQLLGKLSTTALVAQDEALRWCVAQQLAWSC